MLSGENARSTDIIFLAAYRSARKRIRCFFVRGAFHARCTDCKAIRKLKRFNKFVDTDPERKPLRKRTSPKTILECVECSSTQVFESPGKLTAKAS